MKFVVKSKINLKFAILINLKAANCDDVQVPKYNNPRDLYGDAVMEEMISGSSVE